MGSTFICRFTKINWLIKKNKIVNLVRLTTRINGFYSAKLFSMGCTGIVREEEGRIFEDVHRLPGTEQVDSEELISFVAHRRLV